MKRWRVHPAKGPLRGALRVPGDQAIAHRALVLGALAQGESALSGLAEIDDVRATRAALARLGVGFHDDGGTLRVAGVGIRGLKPASAEIDCDDSSATIELLAGVLSAQYF